MHKINKKKKYAKADLKIPGAFVENKGGGFRHAFISPQFFPVDTY